MKKLQLVDSILNLSWLGLVICIAILCLSVSNHFQQPDDEQLAGCGTITPEKKVNYSEEQEETYFIGKKLFKTNCMTCHNRNMVDNMNGPALAGVTDRWSTYPEEDLYHWIRNSQQLIAQKHPRAVNLWKEWQSIMNSFENLSDEDIDAILFYINEIAPAK